MVTVAAGARLVLHTECGAVPLRALARTDLSRSWELPVLAPAQALRPGACTVEVPTAEGLLTLRVRLLPGDGGLVLQATGDAVVELRREDVRGPVELPVRAALDRRPGPAPAVADFGGVTTSLSAGGAVLRLAGGRLPAEPGTRLLLELDVPGSPSTVAGGTRRAAGTGTGILTGTGAVTATGVVSASAVVVAPGGPDCMRVRFAEIVPRDRELLVRLVFAEERRLLASRRAAGDPRASSRAGAGR